MLFLNSIVFVTKSLNFLTICFVTHTQLTCHKMVYKRIYSKEYCFIEQSLCKLKTEEAKMGSIPAEMETADTPAVESLSLAVYLLLLANLFLFNSSFF